MKPSWLQVAMSYVGTHEVPGKGSNAAIMAMAKRLGGWIKSYYTDDDIPWCALFVNSVLQECGIKGTGSLAARSFETWGQPLTEPCMGAILVFSRKGGGHVGFYMGEDASSGSLHVLGGNQSNTVGLTWIAKDRLTTIRWPAGASVAVPGRVFVAKLPKSVSLNEA